MQNDPKYQDYQALLAKVSEKFDEIARKHSQKMQCGRGCHQCCQPDLSVFAVEKEHIREYVESQPGLEDELKQLQKDDPHASKRCRFLRANGDCAIYEVRPLICRSHGVPIYSKMTAQGSSNQASQPSALVDVCPLNFDAGQALSSLAPSDFLNVDLLNQLLVLINRRFEGNDLGSRYCLAIDEITQELK